MDTPYSYPESLNLLNGSEWNKLAGQERAAVIQTIENEVAHREGRPSRSVSLFNEMPQNGYVTAGYYYPRDQTIRMNQFELNGPPNRCLDTILHEGRHAYQHSAVKGEIQHHDKAQLAAWTDNMKPGHYIDAEKNRRAYYRQPVEADAREYAAIVSRQILAEQKIQNEANMGVNKGIEGFREKTAAPAAPVNKGIEGFREKTAAPGGQAHAVPAASANKGIESFREHVAQGGAAAAKPSEANSKNQGQGQGKGTSQDR